MFASDKMFGVGLKLLCIIGTFQGLFHGLGCTPVPTRPVEEIKLHCGESTTLKCYEFNEGNDENVQWWNNGKVLQGKNFWELMSVSTRDKGVYECYDLTAGPENPIKVYKVTLHESNCRKD